MNALVSLKPYDSEGYSQRAAIAKQQLIQMKDPNQQALLLSRIVRDLQRAWALAPSDATMLTCLDLCLQLGYKRGAVHAGKTLLEMLPPLSSFRGWNQQLYRQLLELSVGRLSEWGRDDQPVEAQLTLASGWIALDRFKAAKPLIDRAIRTHPEHPLTLYTSGRWFLAKEPEKAEGALREACRLLPSHFGAKYYLGKALEARENWSQAEEAYAQAERLARFDWQLRESRLGQARVARRRGELARAAELETAARDVAFAYHEDRSRSIPWPEEISLAAFEALIKVWQGNARYLMGEIAEAHRTWDEAFQQAPHTDVPYAHRGDFWLQRGELELALDDYHRCCALEPTDAEFQHRRRLLLLRLGRPIIPEKEGAGEDIVGMDGQTLRRRAELARELGNDREAVDRYTDLLKIRAEPETRLARAEASLYLRQPERTLAYSEELLNTALATEALELAIGVWVVQGDFHQAWTLARRLAFQHRKSAKHVHLVALLLLAQGNTNEYQRVCEALVRQHWTTENNLQDLPLKFLADRLKINHRFKGGDAQTLARVVWTALWMDIRFPPELPAIIARMDPTARETRRAQAVASFQSGRWAEAIKSFRELMAGRGISEARVELPLIAMALHRSGQRELAQQALGEAKAQLQADDAPHLADPPRRRMSWQERLELEVLIKKAEKILTSNEQP